MTYAELLVELRASAAAVNANGAAFVGTLNEVSNFTKNMTETQSENPLIHFAPPTQQSQTATNNTNWQVFIAFTEHDTPGNTAQTADNQESGQDSREEIHTLMYALMQSFLQDLSNRLTHEVQRGSFTVTNQTYSTNRTGVEGQITIVDGVNNIC